MTLRSTELEAQLEQLRYGQSVAELMLELREHPAWKAFLKVLVKRRESVTAALAVALPDKVAKLQGRLQELMFIGSSPEEQDASLARCLADQATLRGLIERAKMTEKAYPVDPELERLKEQAYGS